jgi:hypothetical protein
MRRAIAIVALAALTACAPLGAGPFGGGESSSFSSIGAPVGADAQAHDLLFGGWVAVTASSVGGGFAGVTPGTLHAFDQTMKVVGDAPAKVGVISVNHAGADGVVLSTKSGSGHAFCIAVTPGGTPKTGSVDAQGATSVDDCNGKSWSPLPP